MVGKLETANVVLAIGSGTKGGFGAIIDYSTIHSENILVSRGRDHIERCCVKSSMYFAQPSASPMGALCARLMDSQSLRNLWLWAMVMGYFVASRLSFIIFTESYKGACSTHDVRTWRGGWRSPKRRLSKGGCVNFIVYMSC